MGKASGGSSGGKFGSECLESAYTRWRDTRRGTRRVLGAAACISVARAVAEAPEWRAARAALVALGAVSVIAADWRGGRGRLAAGACFAVLTLDFLLALPTLDAVLPLITMTLATYALLGFPFRIAALLTTSLSSTYVLIYALFVKPLLVNELLALLIVLVWASLVGIYSTLAMDRLGRNAFLSARNAVDAETAAEEQGRRMNRLLSAFLPDHLVSPASQQITSISPKMYAEHYHHVSYVYARVVGLESVLSSCAAHDAARVLRELEARVALAARARGCARVHSDGIAVVAGIPQTADPAHAERALGFARDFVTLISSFREATTADVAACVVVASGTMSAGVIGQTKWHYDVIGQAVDDAQRLYSRVAGKAGIWLSEVAARNLVTRERLARIGDLWKLDDSGIMGTMTSPIAADLCFPVNKRFSLVTVPQAVNRLLQTLIANERNRGTMGPGHKRRSRIAPQGENNNNDSLVRDERGGGMLRLREGGLGWRRGSGGAGGSSLMERITMRFKSAHLEDEYHKEMDRWLIPALAISIFFLVVYGLYHMLVMPRLITSLALIIVALTLMFFILLMLYIDYFHSFSQFITRTAPGHSVAVLLILSVLLLCGVVNTFSCPSTQPLPTSDVCRTPHFSAFSFALFLLTSTAFIRFFSILHLLVLMLSLAIYTLQIFFAHPPVGAKQFGTEFDLLGGLVMLGSVIYFMAREYEHLMRLDFLSAVKCAQECTTAENVRALCGQVQLNIVPAHLASWLAARQKEAAHGEVLQHVHHALGIAIVSIGGLPLHGEQGINVLNYVFSYFDQILPEYKGIEKVKSWNRYYVLAAGLLPDSHNVDEAPRTIGDLLQTLSMFLIHITAFATEKQFEVSVGMDCGSVLSVLCDAERPQFELWGDTLDRARVLCDRAATHGKIAVSEEIYLALRPRSFIFSAHPSSVQEGLNAYTLHCDDVATHTEDDSEAGDIASKLDDLPDDDDGASNGYERFERRNDNELAGSMNIMEAIQHHRLDMTSSMASSYTSELRSLDGGETDSEIEWITPETALAEGYRQAYSEYESDPSRGPSRASSKHAEGAKRKKLKALRGSLPRMGNWLLRRATSGDGHGQFEGEGVPYDVPEGINAQPSSSSFAGQGRKTASRAESMAESYASLEGNATERLDAAARRVDRMLRELQQFGDAVAASTPATRTARDDMPFPTTIGSMKSMNRPGSSACHTEYDNDNDSEVYGSRPASREGRGRVPKRQTRAALAARTRRLRDASVSSIELEPLHKHWRSGYSIGYEDEYERIATGSEMDLDEEEEEEEDEFARKLREKRTSQSARVDEEDGLLDNHDLEADELAALSQDIRRNFGDFQLATFDDGQV